jgi:hypothetical protein
MKPAHGERSASEADAKQDRESVGRMPASLASRPAPASGEQPRHGRREPLGVLRPFNPISWFHPRGIHRVLARLRPRLPNVGGCLFLTFTINPLLFADPSAAFEYSRQHLRRVFYQLRKGVSWRGKVHRIDAPYGVKVEFHGNEWAHFHVVFLTRRFLPAEFLTELWGLGRTNVARISNEHFHYLLKYVTKGGADLPEWVRHRKRLRVFQASRGFLVAAEKRDAAMPAKHRRKRRPSDTLGERAERYQRTALFQRGKTFAQLQLGAPFADTHAGEILPAALDGRYLGGGHYQINDLNQLETWINPPNQPTR